jgi:nicotinate-nucleotide pyrophosphorylase (carboxylating)
MSDHKDKQADQVMPIILRALEEDIGEGDVTTLCTVSSENVVDGKLFAKEAGVIAGLQVARMAFLAVDERVAFLPLVADGDWVETGQVLAELHGPGRALLTAERVALNFLQRMSGIATLTRRFVEAVQGTPAVILDTRKTAPGLRVLDKWAVRLGGGQNHRIGLYDMVLIKENHIAATGSIAETVSRVRECDTRQRAIEVEVRNLVELQEALELDPDRIMLDNMNRDEMVEAVRLVGGRVPLEASGNVNLDNVADVAATGVDYISIGMLTHSVKALDVSLLFDAKAFGEG